MYIKSLKCKKAHELENGFEEPIKCRQHSSGGQQDLTNPQLRVRRNPLLLIYILREQRKFQRWFETRFDKNYLNQGKTSVLTFSGFATIGS